MRMSKYPHVILYKCCVCDRMDYTNNVFALSVRQCVCNDCLFRGAESVGESGNFADAFEDMMRKREYAARHMCQVLY